MTGDSRILSRYILHMNMYCAEWIRAEKGKEEWRRTEKGRKRWIVHCTVSTILNVGWSVYLGFRIQQQQRRLLLVVDVLLDTGHLTLILQEHTGQVAQLPEQSVNQSINLSGHSSMTLWLNDSMTQWLYESMNQWINESMNQWINDHRINQPINQSTNQSINQSINESPLTHLFMTAEYPHLQS